MIEEIKIKWPVPFSKEIIAARQFAFHRHDVYCNQWYDEKMGLRYSYHLQMVADVGTRFIHLVKREDRVRFMILLYCHDIVEDGRITFNELRKVIGDKFSMDVIKISVDPRGITKEDRLSDSYYEEVSGDFVVGLAKLCDRIANLEHGVMTGEIFHSYRNSIGKLRKHFINDVYEEPLAYMEYLLNNN